MMKPIFCQLLKAIGELQTAIAGISGGGSEPCTLTGVVGTILLWSELDG